MHPSKFFSEVKFTDVAFPGVITNQILDKMKDVHPSQFLDSDINIPFYKIEYSYTNSKGNSKDGVKYIFTSDYYDEIVIHIELKFNEWVSKFNAANPHKQMFNVEIINVIPIANAILSIDNIPNANSLLNPSS